jgi:hypothetical protein
MNAFTVINDSLESLSDIQSDSDLASSALLHIVHDYLFGLNG